MPFGCWWFLNNPSIVEEMTRERIEMLGTVLHPAAFRCACLEQVIYKWRNTRRTIRRFWQTLRLLVEDGRPVTREHIQQDVRQALPQELSKVLRAFQLKQQRPSFVVDSL